MTHVVLFLSIVGLFVCFPKTFKHLVAAPLVGVALGGLVWCILAMFFPVLVTWTTLAWALVGGIAVTQFVAHFIDR